MTTTGIDFRGSSGYVTDPSGCTYCVGDSYPTTRAGLTFGWTTAGISAADRSTGVNPRVAGINYLPAGFTITFRVDLPAAGGYSIGVAQGDAGSARTLQSFTIYDNTTSLLSKSANEGSHSNYYMDAAGNVWTSDSAWFSSQVFESLTFASTIFKITIGNSTDYNTLAHLDITASGGTTIALGLASWLWTGVAPGVDATTKLALANASWNWSGIAPGINARTQLALGAVNWAWNAAGLNVLTQPIVTLGAAAWRWFGRGPTVNPGSFVAVYNALMKSMHRMMGR